MYTVFFPISLQSNINRSFIAVLRNSQHNHCPFLQTNDNMFLLMLRTPTCFYCNPFLEMTILLFFKGMTLYSLSVLFTEASSGRLGCYTSSQILTQLPAIFQHQWLEFNISRTEHFWLPRLASELENEGCLSGKRNTWRDEDETKWRE